MINALFIVWRECFEAVLIIGILYSYLKRQENFKRSLTYMWGGVVLGVLISAFLAYGIQSASTLFEGSNLEYFEAGMLTIAAILMAQMCIWMKKHARHLKSELQTGLSEALTTRRLLGVAILTALALSREGFELVMFFYGMTIEASEKGEIGSLWAYSACGVALTALTAWAYNRGLKAFNQKLFFRITTVFLLVTAAGLLVGAVRKLITSDVLPTLKDQVWDTSAILDERSPVGQFFSTMTGYESTPTLMTVLVYFAFWAITMFFYFDVPSRLGRDGSSAPQSVQK